MFNASALTASITVADIRKSMAWYRDVVGFEVQQQNESEGVLRAVVLQAGGVRILLNQEDGARGWDRKKGEGISIQFITRDSVDDIATRIKASGTAIDSEPVDMPWGMRMFRLRDPDGFKLVFSSPLK
jgi:lactoylglutathione lyase